MWFEGGYLKIDRKIVRRAALRCKKVSMKDEDHQRREEEVFVCLGVLGRMPVRGGTHSDSDISGQMTKKKTLV